MHTGNDEMRQNVPQKVYSDNSFFWFQWIERVGAGHDASEPIIAEVQERPILARFIAISLLDVRRVCTPASIDSSNNATSQKLKRHRVTTDGTVETFPA